MKSKNNREGSTSAAEKNKSNTTLDVSVKNTFEPIINQNIDLSTKLGHIVAIFQFFSTTFFGEDESLKKELEGCRRLSTAHYNPTID